MMKTSDENEVDSGGGVLQVPLALLSFLDTALGVDITWALVFDSDGVVCVNMHVNGTTRNRKK